MARSELPSLPRWIAVKGKSTISQAFSGDVYGIIIYKSPCLSHFEAYKPYLTYHSPINGFYHSQTMCDNHNLFTIIIIFNLPKKTVFNHITPLSHHLPSFYPMVFAGHPLPVFQSSQWPRRQKLHEDRFAADSLVPGGLVSLLVSGWVAGWVDVDVDGFWWFLMVDVGAFIVYILVISDCKRFLCLWKMPMFGYCILLHMYTLTWTIR
jgi:hypothetical protein